MDLAIVTEPVRKQKTKAPPKPVCHCMYWPAPALRSRARGSRPASGSGLALRRGGSPFSRPCLRLASSRRELPPGSPGPAAAAGQGPPGDPSSRWHREAARSKGRNPTLTRRSLGAAAAAGQGTRKCALLGWGSTPRGTERHGEPALLRGKRELPIIIPQEKEKRESCKKKNREAATEEHKGP